MIVAYDDPRQSFRLFVRKTVSPCNMIPMRSSLPSKFPITLSAAGKHGVWGTKNGWNIPQHCTRSHGVVYGISIKGDKTKTHIYSTPRFKFVVLNHCAFPTKRECLIRNNRGSLFSLIDPHTISVVIRRQSKDRQAQFFVAWFHTQGQLLLIICSMPMWCGWYPTSPAVHLLSFLIDYDYCQNTILYTPCRSSRLLPGFFRPFRPLPG
jgi:hypothetical protein